MDGLEIGMIVAWALATDPSDSYLECNGQLVDSIKYPKLYQLMHNVPDYRGVFLRGLGSIKYSQLNGALNGITSTTYSSGNLNEIQGDSIRNIYGVTPGAVEESNISFTGVFYNAGIDVGSKGGAGDWRIGFDASRIVPTANENRPINKAVRYFIKAK